MIARSWLAACALAAFAATACGPEFDRTEINAVVSSGLGGSINKSRVTVTEGMALKAHIVPVDDDDEPMPMQIRSRDPDIMDVTRVVSDRDYAFLGLRQGRTEIEIRADGEIVLILEAVVTPQPSAP